MSQNANTKHLGTFVDGTWRRHDMDERSLLERAMDDNARLMTENDRLKRAVLDEIVDSGAEVERLRAILQTISAIANGGNHDAAKMIFETAQEALSASYK